MKEIRLNKDGVEELGNPQEIEVIVDEGYNLMLIKSHVNTKIGFWKVDTSKKTHPLGGAVGTLISRLKKVGKKTYM